MTEREFHTAIRRLISGDKDALRWIYEVYVKLIYSVVYDVLKAREDAEDVTSEFFIKLVRVADSYKKGYSHKAWLVQIARNMALDLLRKKNREVLEFEDDSKEGARDSILETGTCYGQQAACSAPVSYVEEQTVLAQDMKRAMEHLSPKEKEVVDMKLLGDMKFREIAEFTNQPIGTVTWLYNQGILKLRRCLADYAEKT